MVKLTQAALGKALGISAAMVCKLAARGMPTHSVDAAKAWRARNLDPLRLKGTRAPSGPPPQRPARPAGADLCALLTRAQAAAVATLMIEVDLPLEQAALAFGIVVAALADTAADRDLHLATAPVDDALRREVEKLAAAMRAEDAADQSPATVAAPAPAKSNAAVKPRPPTAAPVRARSGFVLSWRK